MVTLHKYKHLFLIISRSIIFITRNVSDKICKRYHQHKFYVQYPFSENRAVYEIMRKNTVDPGRPQVTIWRICIASWIPKAKIILSKYVILIAFRCKNCCMNVPQCKVVLTLTVLFFLRFADGASQYNLSN